VYSSDYTIRTWLCGDNHLLGIDRQLRSVEELLEAETNVWEMSMSERKSVLSFWMEDYRESRMKKFLSAHQEYRKTKRSHDDARQEIDLRCLEEANVIGITTSGLAQHLNLLKRVPIKVVLIEEAGEVLEAHVLTALLPSIEHAILIGDHLQVCSIVL